MPGGHLDVTLDIRKDAIGANRLDVDMGLRGTRLSPLVLTKEHGLDRRIGQRAPHHLSGNPKHMILVLGWQCSRPHEITQASLTWQEVASVFNNHVRLIFATSTFLWHPRNNVANHPDSPIVDMEAGGNAG